MKKLFKLEKKYQRYFEFSDSPTKNIGTFSFSRENNFKHITSMLSLDNVFSVQDFLKFYIKIKKQLNLKTITTCCELKIDGLAINLIYKNGNLCKALTRGDGLSGEDVTKNIINISSIPIVLKGHNIPRLLEARGEVFMLKSDFSRLNFQAKLHSKGLLSNTRNAAAGSIRTHDSKIVKERNLMFCCYGCGYIDDNNYCLDSHSMRLQQLKQWGFPVSAFSSICHSSSEILSFFNRIKKQRPFLDFDIDGIVIKVNSISFQNKLGNISKFPRWAIALKFFNEVKETTVLDVIFQLGRTGVITPIARVVPVFLSGVIISKVSLYNFKKIMEFGIYIGDKILIKRSADVIPKVIKVLKEKRLVTTVLKKISIPKTCSDCKSKLVIINQGIKVKCINGLQCTGQFKKLLYHFCSKNGLNIIGLGPKIIDNLVNSGYVNTLSELFSLNVNLLHSQILIGEKTAINIINSINRSKHISFSKFLFSLGIPTVGEEIANRLANYFISIERLLNANLDDFFLIYGIGKNIARNIYNFFSNKSNQIVVNELLKILKFNSNVSNKNLLVKTHINNFLLGKKIIFSGSLTGFTRSKIKNLAIKLGIVVRSNVSSSIDYIIVGKNPGTKLLRSRKLNIKELKEKEFLSFINNFFKR